ncbi:MFS transporter [Anaerococcus sp. WCA-380-WT-2B]|uniref:MFS transporter n=1 Tax=Anaerococcus porci TaxID=2652269 RepID=A0A6N7VX21_9FIRM|nr:glycoside-pentoside-hexuronide (GPH):cation symporter [Anaerococcus porci]MSS78417.1 MFS transporter [Anaerococcus porci]
MEKNKNKQNHRPFGVKDQLGYIFGDMAGSFVNLTFDAFYLIFATYVLNIDPKFMSTLFLVARLFDAINDPIIGSFPDRWRLGKSGDKFKPWIKLFMWPLAASIFFGFMNINSWGVSESFKHIWVAFFYILYGMSYTGTSMPFGAMANVVTKKPEERSKLSASRAIGGTAIGFGFLGLVPLLIWDKQNNPNPQGYMIMAIIAALGCLISYTLLNKLTIERYSSPNYDNEKKEGYSFTKTLKEALKNRPLLGIMLASIGSLIYITGNSQFGGFVYKEFYQAPKMQTIATFLQIPITVALFFIGPKLGQKYGKRNVLSIALVFNLIVSAFLFFVPIKSVGFYALLYSIGNIGQSFFILYVWAFVGDAIDYHEYKFNSRNDGTLYSTYTFSRKIGTTIVSAGATAILAAIGFVSGADAQSHEVVTAVRSLGTAIPFIACIVELIGIKLVFNLTAKDSEKISHELAKRESND